MVNDLKDLTDEELISLATNELENSPKTAIVSKSQVFRNNLLKKRNKLEKLMVQLGICGGSWTVDTYAILYYLRYEKKRSVHECRSIIRHLGKMGKAGKYRGTYKLHPGPFGRLRKLEYFWPWIKSVRIKKWWRQDVKKLTDYDEIQVTKKSTKEPSDQ